MDDSLAAQSLGVAKSVPDDLVPKVQEAWRNKTNPVLIIYCHGCEEVRALNAAEKKEEGIVTGKGGKFKAIDDCNQCRKS